MKMVSRVFFIMALSMYAALATSHPLANPNEVDEQLAAPPSSSIGDELPSLRNMSRFLEQYNPRASTTCDKFPRVCRLKGSPGPDCCKKQCVNVMTDSLNCGACGRKCRYGEACCGGNCVNIMYDAKNCGGFKKKCKKGNFCKFGMCSYA